MILILTLPEFTALLRGDFGEINHKLDNLSKGQLKIMADITGVQAALTKLGATITDELKAISDRISGGLSSTEADAVVTQIDGFSTAIQAEIDLLKGPPTTP